MPDRAKTRGAVCGKSARTVRRGERGILSLPRSYPLPLNESRNTFPSATARPSPRLLHLSGRALPPILTSPACLRGAPVR
jgi:hypothetical protein